MRLAALSIVVPFFNEEENIEETVRRIQDVFDRRCDAYEVILVDDGSGDRTGALADGLAAKDRRLRALHHPRNLGYGAALRTGFHAARHELVFYTDGDLQFDLSEFDRLLPLLDNHDIVTGYRINRRDPPHRRLNADLYNGVVRLLFGVRVRDLDCAFKIYRKSILDRIKPTTDSIFISGEILIRATRAGVRIGEIGVTHYPRTRGTNVGNNPLIVASALWDLAVFCLQQLFHRDGAARGEPPPSFEVSAQRLALRADVAAEEPGSGAR